MTKAPAAQPQNPYRNLEGTALWKAVEKAIGDLVSNGDLKEQTYRSHIVGYICKVIASRQRATPKRKRTESQKLR
jgi:hypothetical protein